MDTYVVTGFPRSGTSMMMKCLMAGGMDAVYDTEMDSKNIEYGKGDYQPNPGGFYALSDLTALKRSDFAGAYSGKLVKVFAGMAIRLPPGDYKIVVMRRDPDEIIASMREFLPGPQLFVYEPAAHLYEVIFPALIERLETQGRRVTVIEYAKVVENPQAEFDRIAKAGWPIDPAKAAQCVDPALYRSKNV